MKEEHVIAGELLEQVHGSIASGKNWMAYNSSSYFLDCGDVRFFTDKAKADAFAAENFNEFTPYKVIPIHSIEDLFKKFDYGKRLEKILSTKNVTPMNEKNYEYLSNQIKFTGFGEELQAQLKEKIQLQEVNFVLDFQKSFGKDQVNATLHFKKSDETDMYFFNRYTMSLTNERFQEPLKQTFYINQKEESITMKEAYNLLSGRSVHKELANKEGEKYKAWLQIDLKDTDAGGNHKMKQFHQNYGYDLVAVLSSYPIKELQSPDEKQKLVESIEKGNRQSVTMEIGGKETKMFIEASPQFKNMNLYDASMKRITKASLAENQNQTNTQQAAIRKSEKNDDVDEGVKESSQKKSKRRSRKIS